MGKYFASSSFKPDSQTVLGAWHPQKCLPFFARFFYLMPAQWALKHDQAIDKYAAFGLCEDSV